MSDTLPVIPSLQPINSRAPDDETYEVHWNPIWEEEYIPPTPPSASVPMSSSDMEDISPVTSEESVAMSSGIPTAMEATPFPSTPLGVTLPLRYNALRDVMSSRTPSTSSIWSQTITPTTTPFTPQIHNTSITSVPTIPTVCVASSTPVVSGPLASAYGVVDPTSNVPLSYGSILAEGPYDQYLRRIPYDYIDPDGNHLHLGRPLPSQPVVETSVPLSIEWGATYYHGGQATSAHPQGPPNQGQPSYVQTSQGKQYYRQSYPG